MKRLFALIVLTCVAGLIAGAVSASANGHGPAYIRSTGCATCTVSLAQHPRRLGVTTDCEVHGIRWEHWGARTTTGRGTFLCGTGVSEPAAKLVASHLIWCGGHQLYSRLAWTDPVMTTPAGKNFMVPLSFHKSRCEFVAP
jgi:hypothetical protein